MFIYNIKLNGSNLFKIILVISIIIALIICTIVIFKISTASKNANQGCLLSGKVATINNKNYTNILQEVHDNIDTYVGQKIKYSGFVYRVYDFTEEQFVLGRNMIISSDFQSVIVGFLCNYSDAQSFADNSWVELEGTIKKGNYHGDMPIVEVTSIKKIEKPNDEYVYPPDENYIPTSSIANFAQ